MALKKGPSALIGWTSWPILTQKSIFTLRVTHGMNASNTYFETQTQTANPGELVIMLYKGAARFLASAIEAVDAKNLGRIYEYMNYRLVDANLRKDAEPAREVERLLRELLPAWEQAARQTGNAPARKLVSASA